MIVNVFHIFLLTVSKTQSERLSANLIHRSLLDSGVLCTMGHRIFCIAFYLDGHHGIIKFCEGQVLWNVNFSQVHGDLT